MTESANTCAFISGLEGETFCLANAMNSRLFPYCTQIPNVIYRFNICHFIINLSCTTNYVLEKKLSYELAYIL